LYFDSRTFLRIQESGVKCNVMGRCTVCCCTDKHVMKKLAERGKEVFTRALEICIQDGMQIMWEAFPMVINF